MIYFNFVVKNSIGDLMKVDYMSRQVYVLSIIGFIASLFFGVGTLFLIPTLIQCINIKLNYISYSKETIDKALLNCIIGLIYCVLCIMFYFVIIPSL